MVRPANGPAPGAGEALPRIPGLDPVSPPPGAGVPTPKLEPAPEKPRPDQGQNSAAEKPTELQADNVRMENGVATAEGHASLAFGKYNASADTIRYHPDTHSADFIGHVEVKDGINLVQGDEINVNLETGSIKIQGPLAQVFSRQFHLPPRSGNE
jgi:lipopolysaccharide assembly outer membrane protein LptD (OstA)